MRRLDWIKELDYSKHLGQDYNDMIDTIGIDAFLKVYERFTKTQIYFSEKPLGLLKREYVLKNPQMTAKELAYKLEVSERYVEKIRNPGGRDLDTPDMFEEDSYNKS